MGRILQRPKFLRPFGAARNFFSFEWAKDIFLPKAAHVKLWSNFPPVKG